MEGTLNDSRLTPHTPRLLLVQTGFLGDVVLTTPLIAELRQLPWRRRRINHFALLYC